MKKSLIALAVAGTFAAPAAFAATANVDIYGVLNVAVESVDNYGATAPRKTRVTTGNNSALGLKGTEDLGGGLKALWQIETNVNIDGNNEGTTGIGAFNGTRNTFVGLGGGFGTVLMGVHDTPYKLSTGRLDPFVGTLGDYNTLMGAIPVRYDDNNNGVFAAAEEFSSFQQVFDNRTANTIAYMSPTFNGFGVMAAYVVGSENANNTRTDKGNAWSLAGTYAQGPLYLTAAYQRVSLGTVSSSGGATIITASAPDSDKIYAWKVGGGYKFGDLGLALIYEKIDLDDTDRDGWHGNVTYGMGPITLKAAYSHAGDFGGLPDSGAKMWAVGADYALSKRTKVYAVYADLDNDRRVGYGLSQGTNALTSNETAGQNPNGFALGVQHRF